MDYKAYIAKRLHAEGVSPDEIAGSIVVPPDTAMGDLALPCFKFAKILRKSPAVIAEELARAYPADEVIEKASAMGGYLNFKINRKGLAEEVLGRIREEGSNYGSSDMGGGKTVCIDYSSVNIAKHFRNRPPWAA